MILEDVSNFDFDDFDHECAQLILAQAAALVEVEAVEDFPELGPSPVVNRHLSKEVRVHRILGGGAHTISSTGERERERKRGSSLGIKTFQSGGARARTPHHHAGTLDIEAAKVWQRLAPDSDEGLTGWYSWAWSPPPRDNSPGCVA